MEKKPVRPYVLITSAYNEELFLEKTIESVLKQTVPPSRWIIISDGSEDGTDDIIQRYEKTCPFISYRRRTAEEKEVHDFASKVHAVNSVLNTLDFTEYDFLGILDADILLAENYYETLMAKADEDEAVGILGGIVFEPKHGKLVRHESSLNTVCGGIMLARMACFTQLGNFLPMRYGGEDSMMCVKANSLGWLTRSFTDAQAQEQRVVGGPQGKAYKVRNNDGKVYWDMGYHPLYFLIHCLFRLKEKPVIVGSISEFFGYLMHGLRRTPRTPSAELIAFLRKDQLQRLRHITSARK